MKDEKFLDGTGLSRVWDKCKASFPKIEDVVLAPVEIQSLQIRVQLLVGQQCQAFQMEL